MRWVLAKVRLRGYQPGVNTPPHRPDRWRWTIVGVVLVAQLGLGMTYTHRAMTLPDGVRACLAEPQAHDGVELVFPVWFVAGIDGPRRYRVSRVVKDVVVEGDSAGLEQGQVITLVGRFRGADSVVLEERREIHHLRPYKHGLSLLGLVLALLAAPAAWTWRAGYLRSRATPRAQEDRHA